MPEDKQTTKEIPTLPAEVKRPRGRPPASKTSEKPAKAASKPKKEPATPKLPKSTVAAIPSFSKDTAPMAGQATSATGQIPSATGAIKTGTAQFEAQTGTPKKKISAEQQRIKKEEQGRSARRRNRQLIGFALTLLIIVGAVSIVRGGIDLAKNLLNSDEERMSYQKRFEPLVWFNILPFESVSLVDENSIKQVCIWGVVSEMKDKLERNERGEAMVPASEVDRYATGIFGPDFRFSGHESFTDPVKNLTYIYSSETTMYAMPVTSEQMTYMATVVEIQREAGGVKRVVMGYVSTRSSDDQMLAMPDYEHPVMYKDFMLRRDGSEYYLYAIQDNTTHKIITPAASEASSLPPEQQESLPPPTVAPGDDLSAADSTAA